MVYVPKWVTKCTTCGNKHPYYSGKCPLVDLVKLRPKLQELPKVFFGPTPSVFVGHAGYPKVFLGPMGALEEDKAVMADTPENWYGMDYEKIISLRAMLIRSKQLEQVKSKSRFVEENQLLAMSSKPTDVELNFKKKPHFNIELDYINQPLGPSAQLMKMDIVENVRVKPIVETIVNDELKAEEQATGLYSNHIDIYKIMAILSSGSLGLDSNKKLVPTRWSITAIDDILAKNMLAEIRDFNSVNHFEIYEAEYLDNHFVVLLMPGKWEFENFEAWAPGSNWATNLKEAEVIPEYESHYGRTTYAESQAGGYYATRFAITEHLHQNRKQARIVVFREVGENYVIPVGVFVVRETVRDALRKKPIKFNTQKEALLFIQKKLRLPINKYLQKSKLLVQKRLGDFRP